MRGGHGHVLQDLQALLRQHLLVVADDEPGAVLDGAHGLVPRHDAVGQRSQAVEGWGAE